jgi:hypothetical protein
VVKKGRAIVLLPMNLHFSVTLVHTLLKYVIEGKAQERIELKGRRRRRGAQLLEDLGK